jgi:hypothetical protein
VRTSTVRYATKQQLALTFDSTSRFWTNLSGADFLNGLDNGSIDTTNESVQKVLRILDYVRPNSKVIH